MQFAIVEDEPLEQRMLADYLERYARERSLLLAEKPGLFGSGEAFLSAFEPGRYDAVFLDVYLDGIDGMDTARSIRRLDRRCQLVFVTVSDRYAVQSYDVEAAYYLVKPYDYARLCQALGRCALGAAQSARYITIGAGAGKKLLLCDILYVSAYDRRVEIHLRDGAVERLRAGMTEFFGRFADDPRFLACCRGFLVNMDFIQRQQADGFLMSDGAVIPISRPRAQEISTVYIDYLFDKARDRLVTEPRRAH